MSKTMTDEPTLQQKAIRALEDCLGQVPFVQVKDIGREGPDLLAELSLDGGKQKLRAEVKNSGEPRWARQAANSLFRYVQENPGTYPVFMAPYISPAAGQICEQEGLGFVDFSGNCHLSFARVFVHQEGRPNKFARSARLRSLYAPKATRVLRVLLNDPQRTWRLVALAQEASVSLAMAHHVKELLEDREWVASDKSGLRLVKPGALLSSWAENYASAKNRAHSFYSEQRVKDSAQAIADCCRQQGVAYGLTGLAGADRLAPYARYQRVEAYVVGDIERIADLIGLKPVPSGANVSLLEPYDAGVLYGVSEVEGVAVVSSAQVYLGLVTAGSRGEDAARFLLEKVLQPRW